MNQIKLFVLAGGFGTRLRTAVADVPKALAPVMGRPFLYYLLENWVSQGVRSFTFLLHHQAKLIEAFLAEQQMSGGLLQDCQIQVLIEPEPMGTGGAVAYAVKQLKQTGSFLVVNADTWLGTGIQQLSEASVPAMGLVHVPNAERYGSVSIQGNKIVAFVEKKSSRGPQWINAGMYHLNAEVLQDWDGLAFSMEQVLFPKLVSTGNFSAISLDADFIDIGIPEDYFRFCKWIESRKMGRI